MAVLLEEALAALMAKISVMPTVRRPLAECYGWILAEDIISNSDFPPFNRSPLDGYAVRFEDICRASFEQPAFLTQVDYVPAGRVASRPVNAGQAIRIMTGAPIPEGADAVVRIEDTAADKDRIAIFTSAMASKNICNQGEEFKQGDAVLKKGRMIGEGEMGLLAMLGYEMSLVYRKPRVGILATGSELIPLSEPLRPGKIHDSNSYMLLAKVRRAGAEPVLLGSVKDDLDMIIAKLKASPGLSMYLTTGGASVGDYDLMEQLFERLNIDKLFSRVAIKPGMPVIAGIWQAAPLIALSGNPAASSVSFEVLVAPLLRKMAGYAAWNHTRIKVRVAGGFKKATGARRFVWVRCFAQNGIIYAKPLGYQGNGMLRSVLEANALLDIPANSPPVNDGDELEALLLFA